MRLQHASPTGSALQHDALGLQGMLSLWLCCRSLQKPPSAAGALCSQWGRAIYEGVAAAVAEQSGAVSQLGDPQGEQCSLALDCTLHLHAWHQSSAQAPVSVGGCRNVAWPGCRVCALRRAIIASEDGSQCSAASHCSVTPALMPWLRRARACARHTAGTPSSVWCQSAPECPLQRGTGDISGCPRWRPATGRQP